MPLRLACCALLFVSVMRAGSFDEPHFKRTVDLGPSKYSQGTRAKVTCYFFHDFMVKEVDLGEKGASRLSIVPSLKTKQHTCSRLHDEGEKAINPDDWSGYFKGVKGNLVFFDADDGWNGGLGFAVFDAKTAKKIFDDVALGDLDIAVSDNQVSLRYTRVAEGDCVVLKDPSGCWDKIRKKLQLENSSAPDCKAGYEKSAQDLAKGRCQAQNSDNPPCLEKEIKLARQQANDAPSVVSYPVEVVLGSQPSIKPVGGTVNCWPSD